jgi:hypothetical protein
VPNRGVEGPAFPWSNLIVGRGDARVGDLAAGDLQQKFKLGSHDYVARPGRSRHPIRPCHISMPGEQWDCSLALRPFVLSPLFWTKDDGRRLGSTLDWCSASHTALPGTGVPLCRGGPRWVAIGSPQGSWMGCSFRAKRVCGHPTNFPIHFAVDVDMPRIGLLRRDRDVKASSRARLAYLLARVVRECIVTPSSHAIEASHPSSVMAIAWRGGSDQLSQEAGMAACATRVEEYVPI